MRAILIGAILAALSILAVFTAVRQPGGSSSPQATNAAPLPAPETNVLRGTVSAKWCYGSDQIADAIVNVRDQQNGLIGSTHTNYVGDPDRLGFERIRDQHLPNSDVYWYLYAFQQRTGAPWQALLDYDTARVRFDEPSERSALSHLFGTDDFTCTVDFEVPVPRARFYQLMVGTHPITYTYEELAAKDFAVALSLR